MEDFIPLSPPAAPLASGGDQSPLSAERIADMYSTLDREALWRNEAEETAACYVRDVTDLLLEVRRLRKAEARLLEEQAAGAEQEREKLELVKELQAKEQQIGRLLTAGAKAVWALESSYDVNEWPTNGETAQDKAAASLRAAMQMPVPAAHQEAGEKGAPDA